MRRAVLPLLLVLALLATGCGVIAGAGTYEVHAEFARTYNLFPGSPVRVLGIDVGKVKDLHVSPDRATVLVDLVIDDGVELPAEVTAAIIPQSLLGERYVQFDPPYAGGDRLEEGATIPVDRTGIPAEFDDILESLNEFVGTLDEDEVARLITNLAEVLDGQGASLGRTIDQAHEAIAVLRDNDEELVALAQRLADLNATLSTRDQQFAQLLVDWNSVARTVVDERGNLDRALQGLVRLTSQLSGILELHREDLQDDIATLTRVARTADRNIGEFSRLILFGAELFRHAERVVERQQHGWLPLVNHSDELGNELMGNLADRLQHLCDGLGLPGEVCAQLTPENLSGGGAPPCPDPLPCGDLPLATGNPLTDALRRSFDLAPGLEQALRDQQPDSPLLGLLDEEPAAPAEQPDAPEVAP